MPSKNQDYHRYIRENVPLSDVCARLDLYTKQHGVQVRALCPFHNDRTPSLHIYRDHYHCYVCQAHGDLFNLVQKVNGVDFPGAVAWVEEQFPFVLGQKPVKSKGRRQSQTPFQIALDYYSAGKCGVSPAIADKRGYQPEFLRKAEVYQTDGHVLCGHAAREELDALLSAQLIQRDARARPEDLSPYQDYFFKERLLFTLRDAGRRVVGFAGRSTSENDKPKYLYTKDLRKNDLLYRLDKVIDRWNRTEEAECSLYLVEGLFDALRLESLGLDAAAVLGSHLTDGQLLILERIVEQQRQRGRTVALRCFLDSDKAGVEGAYQLIRSVWRSDILRDTPLAMLLDSTAFLNPSEASPKDPDEFLKGMEKDAASAWLEKRQVHPMEFLLRRFLDQQNLAFDGDELETQWENLPLLPKVRILNQLSNLFSETVWKELLSFYTEHETKKCFALTLLDRYLRTKADPFSETVNAEKEPRNSPYALALEMARTGYKQESLPLDDASWDRLSAGIELVGRHFDRMLPGLRSMPPAQPLLAFSTPKDEEQDRLKALPDHEELLLQHYLLNELLREDVYPGYARSIPAVRHDPLAGGAYTTGLGYGDTFQNTGYKAVSFAYQVDMPVLRGERRPSDGLFRHYYDCWKDFVSFLRDGIERLDGDRIYRARLDIRGYYDNIRKYSVRDVLIGPLSEAFGYAQNAFQKLNDNGEDRQKQAEKVIDLLLERLFGWSYLDPQTGAKTEAPDPLRGIPQGPALSAYAANVLLFPLDREVSQYINQVNSACETGTIRVRYARYVDDMIILASDPAVLAKIEGIINDRLGALGLELSPKTDHPDAVEKEEARWWLLDERGGLGVSAAGFVPEDTLDELWGTGYEPYVVDRHDALNILKSAADILDAPERRFDEALTACFRTENVRFRDASRLAALLLEYLLNQESLSGSLYEAFSRAWRRERQQMGVRSMLSRRDVEPLAFLEGLLILLRRNISATLPSEEQAARRKVQLEAARHIANSDSVERARKAYEKADGRNISLLEVKIIQLRVLSLLSLSIPPEETDVKQLMPENMASGVHRYLQRWQYMLVSGRENPVWDNRFPIFHDFPSDHLDEFQLFHHLTACLGCCTRTEWFWELASQFRKYTKSDVGISSELRQIEQIWFLPGGEAVFVDTDHARLALQTLSNFLQRDCLPKVISQNPAMCSALFSEALELIYLPVPPVPEFSYPGIFALDERTAYRAEVAPNGDEQPVVLDWEQLPDSASEHWTSYHAGLPDGGWHALTSPLPEKAEEWTPRLAADAADLYEKLRELLKRPGPSPILSRYHLFLDKKGSLRTLTYYHTEWKEPTGVALAGGSPFLKWTALDRGPGKAERAAALLLEDLLDLRQYAAGENLNSSNLLKLLSYGLERLTGRKMSAHLSGLSEQSFAQTVRRTLDLWRRFSKASPEEERLVLLEAALTDRLMSARLDWHRPGFRPGEDSAFLERWAAIAVRVELPRLSEVLPERAAAAGPDFPMRRSVAAWRAIGLRLLRLARLDAVRALGASALLRAVCLDLRMRVLECVRALRSGELKRLKEYPLPFQLLQVQEPAALLVDSEEPPQAQAEKLLQMMERYHEGDGSYQMEAITPAGWYLLLAWVLELNGDSVSPRLHPELETDRKAEARAIWEEAGQLLFPPSSEDEEAAFPYQGLKPLLQTGEQADRILSLLHRLDEMLDFTICRKRSSGLSFGKGSPLKMQMSLQIDPSVRMTVPTGFVSFLHDSTQMPEYEGNGTERVWTQTMLGDQILSLAVVTRKAANLAWGELSPPQEEAPEMEPPASLELRETAQTVSEPAAPEQPERAQSGSERPDAEKGPDPETPLPKEQDGTPFRSALGKLQQAQKHSWTLRKNFNGNIDRIAFFQFDADDSYVHPLAECCNCQEGDPPVWKWKKDPVQWDREQAKAHQHQLYSCAEHRRRQLLKAVFNACAGFDVDILLLPEYSVRMETVQWMLEFLQRDTNRYRFSVWAGTCRLTPGRNYESEALKELNRPGADCQAVLPVICQKPALALHTGPDPERRYPLLYLGRSKKYPSISMEEVIRPQTRELNPIMKDPGQLGGQMYGDARDDVMELICAEVFLATNPGNTAAFAQVYDMLQRRFHGKPMGVGKQMEIAQKDLYAIGERTSLVQLKSSYLTSNGKIANGPGKYGRTPVLLVPAYTTRTVDYYVTGQAGYLATGLTTVFCNAVGLSSRGESCFIGTDCWEKEDGKKSPFMPDYSPYHGALPGVYRQFDAKAGHGALGRYEQAVVICDINPLAASGGRPRPESMLHPLTLVAHLPIIESVTYRKATDLENGRHCGPYDQCRCQRQKGARPTEPGTGDRAVQAIYALAKCLESFEAMEKEAWTTAHDRNPKALAEALEQLGLELNSRGLQERAGCYREFHQSNPHNLPPATLLDWIWVDVEFPTVGRRDESEFLDVPEFTETKFQKPNW